MGLYLVIWKSFVKQIKTKEEVLKSATRFPRFFTHLQDKACGQINTNFTMEQEQMRNLKASVPLRLQRECLLAWWSWECVMCVVTCTSHSVVWQHENYLRHNDGKLASCITRNNRILITTIGKQPVCFPFSSIDDRVEIMTVELTWTIHSRTIVFLFLSLFNETIPTAKLCSVEYRDNSVINGEGCNGKTLWPILINT
jgi:hypothetical protein